MKYVRKSDENLGGKKRMIFGFTLCTGKGARGTSSSKTTKTLCTTVPWKSALPPGNSMSFLIPVAVTCGYPRCIARVCALSRPSMTLPSLLPRQRYGLHHVFSIILFCSFTCRLLYNALHERNSYVTFGFVVILFRPTSLSPFVMVRGLSPEYM